MYATASTEPLDIIEHNECRAPGSLVTSRFQACFNEIERLQAALKPFAVIGLDVLENHPGWANAMFSGEWCGYRLTYVQFEAAAAAAIVSKQNETTPRPCP